MTILVEFVFRSRRHLYHVPLWLGRTSCAFIGLVSVLPFWLPSMCSIEYLLLTAVALISSLQ